MPLYLPATVSHRSPFQKIVDDAHELYGMGHNDEALRSVARWLPFTEGMGDRWATEQLLRTRIYSLSESSRFMEAITAAEDLLHRQRSRVGRAKTMADIADVMVRTGRLEEGFQRLAEALVEVDTCLRNAGYARAMCSIGVAAQCAELYEVAADATRAYALLDPHDTVSRMIGDLQSAELLLEWGLRLGHVGQGEQAALRLRQAAELARPWSSRSPAPPATEPSFADVLLALAWVSTGAVEAGMSLAAPLVVPLRAEGAVQEARIAHLALGIGLRLRGDLPAARRELTAAHQLAVGAGRYDFRLVYQYELGLLAAAESPGAATATLLTALHDHALELWRQRLDRLTMLRQARRRVELERARQDATAQATRDALTGLHNRRVFDQRMATIAETVHGGLCLMLVDVDRFKEINDTYSHTVGDRVLRTVADILAGCCVRSDDLVVRFGGDEFVVFTAVGRPGATRLSEAVRDAVRRHDWHTVRPGLAVSVSIGLAELQPGMTSGDLMDAADANMYAVKQHRAARPGGAAGAA